jgi:AcrR family transcriptional regulator
MFKKNTKDTKELILKIAMQVFAKYGFRKTSINDIAQAAFKSKGSVHYYYKNKNELFQKVVEKEFQLLRTELELVAKSDLNGKMKLTNYIITRMKILRELSYINDAIKNGYMDYEYFAGKIRKKFDDEEILLVKEIISNGIINDEFEESDEEQTAYVIVSALKGLEEPLMVNIKCSECDINLDYMIQVLLKGIEKR